MICPECNGSGETVYYIETDRDENSVTVVPRKGICRTCNGSGKKLMTNADRIRSMNDAQLASMLKDYKDCSKNCIISNGKHCYQICEEESVLLKWLQQPAEETDSD